VAFRQRVAGSHGGLDETYDCELTLVDGTVAIQDWSPAEGGIVSGTVRGTLKLTSSSGSIPPIYSQPTKIDIKFWAKLSAK
jgi:hypothetical protein